MTRRMTLERAVDLAIAAENRRALADPQLDEWIEHQVRLWRDLEDRGEVPVTSRESADR